LKTTENLVKMNLFRKSLFFTVAVSFITGAFATDVKIDDGETLFGTDIEIIDIDPISGVIKITTFEGNYGISQIPASVEDPVVDLFANNNPSSISVPLDTLVSIRWDVSQAVSCAATGGGTTDWSLEPVVPGAETGLTDGTFEFTIDFTDETSFRLDCDGVDGTNPQFAEVRVTGEAPGVPTVNLLVEGLSTYTAQDAETNVRIHWTTSDVDTCVTSGGNADWDGYQIPAGDVASGEFFLDVDFTESTEFTLECTRTVDNVADNDLITINVDTVCDISPLAIDMTATARNALTVDWADLFGKTWPEPFTSTKTIVVETSRYMALKFTTPTDVGEFDGGIRSVDHPETNGGRYAAISQCPGDFENVINGGSRACKQTITTTGTLRWTTAPNPEFNECILQPGTTYYYNITFTDGINNDVDACTGTPCLTNLDVFYN
jgi:hypothetical protein